MLYHVPPLPRAWDTSESPPPWLDRTDKDTYQARRIEPITTRACRAWWHGWFCTRPFGHTKRHEAGALDYIVAVWPEGEPGSRPAPPLDED